MQSTLKFIKRHKKNIGIFVEFLRVLNMSRGAKRRSWGYTQQTERTTANTNGPKGMRNWVNPD
jgi:hypothetical protein